MFGCCVKRMNLKLQKENATNEILFKYAPSIIDFINTLDTLYAKSFW